MSASGTTVRIKWHEATVDAATGTVTVRVESRDDRVRSEFLTIAAGRNVLIRGERWGPIAWAGGHISVAQVEQGAELALKEELEAMLAHAGERALRKQAEPARTATRRTHEVEAAGLETEPVSQL